MNIKIIGKEHAQGKRKADGTPFDFLKFYYLGRDRYRRVEGNIGCSFTAEPDLVDYASIKVGEVYDVQFDERGNCVSMTPVKG